MKTIGLDFPQLRLTETEASNPRELAESLVNMLLSLKNYIAGVVDFNACLDFSQNGAPTTTQILAGQAAVWKDADATTGQSTHYLVYNDGGTVVTFASVETAP